jgi:hypothetical protein
MAKVGAQRAAELTGRSKSTIQRAMNNGKISFERDANGRRIIDVSELERAFGFRPGGNEAPPAEAVETELKKAAEMIEMERMKMRVRMLEDQLDTTREQLDDLKEQRDQWQKQAQQVLLTSQYSQKQAENLQEELKERERKEQERRRQAMEAKMKRMQGENQNQSAKTQTSSGAVSELTNVQAIWDKIKKKASVAS